MFLFKKLKIIMSMIMEGKDMIVQNQTYSGKG
jgi:hypothetical protein